MDYPHFVGPSYVSQSSIADQEETINWYVERLESPGAATRMALYPTPGVETLATGAAGPGRGHFFDSSSQREFMVLGTTFYECSQAGTLTSRGTVAVDGNPATLSSNGDGGGQIFVTSGGNGYIFTLATNTFAAVAALAGKATVGGHLDGYFLALDVDTSTLWVSDLLDGSTWDPTQFTQRSIAPDPWIGMIVANRYIYLLGRQTSEVWYDAGAASFPFAPHPSGLLQWGCSATFSPAVLNGAVYWLSATENGQGDVLRTSGFTVEQVSTRPVATATDSYSTITDAIGDAYEEAGHGFYNLTFPTGNVTWSYDADEQLWHKRGTWSVATASYDAWRPIFDAFAFGEHRMLDLSGANVYRASIDLATDVEGGPLRRVRRAPALVYENQRLFYSAFELDLEPGLGLVSGQGSNPQVAMRMSNDGGKTWGTEMMRGAGALGEYGTRVRWNRCGAARKRVFEVVVTDPIPWRIVGAYLTLQNPPQAVRGNRAA